MLRRQSHVPSYQLIKRTGKSKVRIDGRDIYLGEYGSDESRRKYGELIAAHCSGVAPDAVPGARQQAGPTVAEIVVSYLRYGETYYVKNGCVTSELSCMKTASGPLLKLYGMTLARDFSPPALKAVRDEMVSRGWGRKSINRHVSRIRLIFQHAVENGFVRSETWVALKALRPLLEGKTDAVENAPVTPVEESRINAVLPHASRQVKDMIRLQLLCGCRPDEIVTLRPCDVNRDADEVWEYVPQSHKNQHRGKQRRIYFGPRAQTILVEYLNNRPATSPCFSPAEAAIEHREKLRKARVTNVQPSQVARAAARKRRQRLRPPAEKYGTGSYRRAIHRACDAAKIPRWSPNQLRHSRATNLRKQYGIEAAQVVCGHSQLSTTQIYAERDFQKARKIMSEVG